MRLSRQTKHALYVGGAAAAAVAGLVLLGRRASAFDVPAGCRLQSPQPFLIRANYLKDRALFAQAVKFRTEQYGYFPGFGDSSMNATSPAQNAVDTTFFGLPIRLNRKIVPILKCVETALKADCSGYRPKALSGLRPQNSYHGFEVSNHVYGIAIDIDPNLNPCCGCVGHWADDPVCKQPDTGPYSRMAMPECWVHVFERFGFYWLGHDTSLRDTMHFEFLGIP